MARSDRSSKTMLIKISPEMAADARGEGMPARIKPKAVHYEEADAPSTKVADVPVGYTDVQQLFQGVYDAGFLADLDGNIVEANVRAVQFFFYSMEELCRMHISQIIPGLDDSVVNTICRNLENDKFTLMEAQCERKDGAEFPAEISTSRLCYVSGEKDFLCFFIRDVTLRKQAEDALRWAHDQLEERVQELAKVNEDMRIEIAERKRIEGDLNDAIAKLQEHDKAKSEFVSNVSHEFRTPLASIGYMSGNILRGIFGPIPEGMVSYVEMIKGDAQRLAGTVEDILDISRIEAKALVLNKGIVQFPWLVHKCVDAIRVQAEAEQLTMTLSVNANGFISCDRRRMERAVVNILKNAIKFNRRGGNISVTVETDDEKPGFIILNVEDTGIGIESEYLSRVSERFFRVGEFVSGTGLGLAICREIVEFHGGTLRVASPPPGKEDGTMVSISLPAANPAKILVVSDDESIRDAVINQLTDYAFEVVYGALSGVSAEVVGETAPDVVCVDWMGSGMDGGIILGNISNDENLRNIPVFVITSVDETEGPKKEIIDGLGLPVLVHPWREKDLLNCLEDCMAVGERLSETPVGTVENK